jgi:hypothetical protein
MMLLRAATTAFTNNCIVHLAHNGKQPAKFYRIICCVRGLLWVVVIEVV